MKLYVCAWVFERKAVIATEYKAARFLQRWCVPFLCSSFSFSNTTEPKGHFIDHSEVMLPDVYLIYLNVTLFFCLYFIQSTHLVQYENCKSGLLL